MNYKIKCVGYNAGERNFTIGKVYDVVDTVVTCDDGFKYEHYKGQGGITIDKVIDWFKPWYEFEIVEGYKVGDHVVAGKCNIEFMHHSTGDTGVIVDINEDSDYPYDIQFDKDKYLVLWCKVLGYADERVSDPKIKNVIFNDPATIVQWSDGSKTVVKCRGEEFDPEKGMAMAIAKKTLGDHYWDEFQKWVKHDKKHKNPLTLKQIKAMDGQKIWLSSIDDGKENFTDEYCGWYTVNVKDDHLYSRHCGRYHLNEGFNDKWWGYKAYYNDMSKEK